MIVGLHVALFLYDAFHLKSLLLDHELFPSPFTLNLGKQNGNRLTFLRKRLGEIGGVGDVIAQYYAYRVLG